ncbi:MAG: adenosylmethionine--8-amino-7-oxononanoate transaminase [Planctomycetales bacterium]|nr:adenosylmethionine--8-amino-7-oxononanoate transaminase [Planctomycetales bacterium]
MPAPSNHELTGWDCRHYWHAFTQMAEYEPLIIREAHGCRLVDIEGREFIDGVASLWCNVHGHRHPKIDAAIRAQLDRIAHCTSLGASNDTAIELAKRLADLSPAGLEHVFFASDGAASVEVALKMAFQYWRQCSEPQPQKTKYAALASAYHGDTIGSVSVGGVARFHEMFEPLLFEVVRVPAPDLYRLPDGVDTATATEFYLSQAEALLAEHHDELAALVVEPLVQGAAGILVQPSGYLAGLRNLTRKYDVLLIADEVAVGFGRTGTLFACEQESVSPDFLCLGKGLTGGYLPMSATVAATHVFEAFLGRYDEMRTFFHGHTFGGNPLAAAAALATFDVFEEEQTLARLPEKVGCMAEHLERIAGLPHVGDVRQKGLMAGIELVADKALKLPFAWQERRGAIACRHAMEHGVWLRPLGDVIVVMPPLSVSLDELEQILRAAELGIRAATE